MKAQEKLNKIDEMLVKAGMHRRDTLEKVATIIQEHREYKNRLAYRNDQIQSAISTLKDEEV